MQTESLGSAATLEMLVVSRCREEHGGGGGRDKVGTPYTGGPSPA